MEHAPAALAQATERAVDSRAEGFAEPVESTAVERTGNQFSSREGALRSAPFLLAQISGRITSLLLPDWRDMQNLSSLHPTGQPTGVSLHGLLHYRGVGVCGLAVVAANLSVLVGVEGPVLGVHVFRSHSQDVAVLLAFETRSVVSAVGIDHALRE